MWKTIFCSSMTPFLLPLSPTDTKTMCFHELSLLLLPSSLIGWLWHIRPGLVYIHIDPRPWTLSITQYRSLLWLTNLLYCTYRQYIVIVKSLVAILSSVALFFYSCFLESTPWLIFNFFSHQNIIHLVSNLLKKKNYILE